MATFNIVLDKRKKLKGGKYNLAVRMVNGNDVMYINLQKMTEGQYDKVFNNKVKDEDSSKFLETCNGYISKCNKIFSELKPFNKEIFRKRFWETENDKPKSLVLTELFDYYIENKENIKPTTIDSLRYTKNRFENFRAGVSVGDVTVSFLKKFERNEIEVSNSQATIDHHMRNLRTIINYFTHIVKVIPKEYEYPFGKGGFTISSYFPSKQVLKESEIKSVIDFKDFKTEEHRFARDVFILLYRLNGANFADLLRMRWSQIDGDYIFFTRKKTESTRRNNKKLITVPLTDKLLDSISLVGDKDSPFLLGRLKEGYDEETFKNRNHKIKQQINRNLKDIRDQLKLSRPLQLGTARDCYASTLDRNNTPRDESFKGQLPELEKELGQLIKSEDANVILLYSRRCMEVIITDLCECELKRPRKTEPLKGIIDKLHKEEKVPAHIISSMQGLNELSTYGAHPKDFDPEQVKPVLVNLDIIIKWYLKYKDSQIVGKPKSREEKHESKQPAVLLPKKSIIVLPFENMSPDPDQEYFSDGLTEEIITDLSYIKDLLVISRSSAMTFKGSNKKIKDIANEVNVQYVLEGSVRKAGNNLRITAQLIDGTSDSHIWAEKYSGTLDDIFDIQEKVSQSIVNALKLRLSPQESERITIKPTRNIQQHECYLKARYEIYTWTKESLDRAVHILQTGLENFGDDALLYATLGEAKYLYYDIGVETGKKILNEVEEFAEKALSINPDIAQGYKLHGLLEIGRGSLVKGYKYMKKAYNADPNDPGIIMHTAEFFMYVGKPSLSEPLYKKLLDIDPLTSMNYLFAGFSQYFQGNFKKAIEQTRKSLQIDPEFVYSIFWHPVFLAANNQKNKALELMDQIIKEGRLSEVFTELMLFIKYALMGIKTQALNSLSDETKKYTWNDPLFSGLMPGYFSLINEKEKALDYLNHALDRGFINYPFFSNIDPFLENIRGEERYKKLMERVKYEWENFEV